MISERPGALLVTLALCASACGSPTAPDPQTELTGNFATTTTYPRETLPRFQPAIAVYGGAGWVEVTGFVPLGLCRHTLAARFHRAGRDVVVTLDNPRRPDADSRVCIQIDQETRYVARVYGLPADDYRVLTIQNPARRFVGDAWVERVDTVIAAGVRVVAAP